jgi:hypothetical protein
MPGCLSTQSRGPSFPINQKLYKSHANITLSIEIISNLCRKRSSTSLSSNMNLKSDSGYFYF